MKEENLIKILKEYSIDDIKSIKDLGFNQYEIELQSKNPIIIKFFPPEEKEFIDERVKKIKKIYDSEELTPNYIFGELSDDKIFLLWKKGKTLENKNFEFGEKLGKFLKKYHSEFQSNSDDWKRDFNHRIVLLLHNYYMSKHNGSKDYIILDYLTENKYLISDRTPSLLLGIENILNISVDEEGRLSNIDLSNGMLADPYFEFKNLNFLKDDDLDFVKGIVNGYFENGSTILFFKTIALYTIMEYLYEEFEDYKNVNHQAINEKIDKILEIYSDFTDIYPNWFKN